MRVKSCPAIYTKTPHAGGHDPGDESSGIFEAIVSVFGNADRVGDVVMPGAFHESLKAWQASPDVLPVLWSHRVDDPMYNIGAVLEAEEVSGDDPRIPAHGSDHLKSHGGLWVRAQLDIGPDASPIAKQAHRLLTARRVTQFSYAYDVEDEGETEDGYNALRKLWLHEVSPTQIGCNDLTELVGAKRRPAEPANEPAAEPANEPAEVKQVPRGLSAADTRLRIAIAEFQHANGYHAA